MKAMRVFGLVVLVLAMLILWMIRPWRLLAEWTQAGAVVSGVLAGGMMGPLLLAFFWLWLRDDKKAGNKD